MSDSRDKHRLVRRSLLIALGLCLFLGFVALGTWQIQRRAWKLALIERVEQRVHAKPVALPPTGEWAQVTAASHEYLPVQLTGQWLTGKTQLVQALTELGSGYWVLTPLQLDEGGRVWVNRGFVPQDQRSHWLPAASEAAAQPMATPSENVAIEGLLRISEPKGGFLRPNDPAQQRWYSRDVAALNASGALSQAAPFFVDAGLPGRTDTGSASASEVWPRPGLTVIRFSNSHLVYALTWYGLALLVVLGARSVASYERKRLVSTPRAHENPIR